jgi:hypothetical protein
MTRRHDPCRCIHDLPEVVTLPLLCFPSMQTHPHTQHDRLRPALPTDELLDRNGSTHGVARRAERSRERVTRRGEHVPAPVLDRRSQQLVMAFQRHLHLSWLVLPQTAGPLDIGEQKRHGPRRRRKLAGHPDRIAQGQRSGLRPVARGGCRRKAPSLKLVQLEQAVVVVVVTTATNPELLAVLGASMSTVQRA